MATSDLAQPTDEQRRIRALAAQMTAANTDAAEELAKALAAEVAQARRLPSLGIGLGFNVITGRLEIRAG